MTDEAPKLLGVRTVSVSGDTDRLAPVKSAEVSLNAEWAFAPESINFRFTIITELRSAEAAPEATAEEIAASKLGTVGGIVVVQYQTPDGMAEPEGDDWYIAFIRSRALGDVMPYVRELVGATANRIGFADVLIDAIPGHNFGR